MILAIVDLHFLRPRAVASAQFLRIGSSRKLLQTRQLAPALGKAPSPGPGPRTRIPDPEPRTPIPIQRPCYHRSSMPATLLQKVWDAHTVRKLPNGQTQLFVGLHLIHEVTTPQAFDMLRARGWKVRVSRAHVRARSITSCRRAISGGRSST